MVDRYDDVVARIHGPSGKSVSYDDYAAMEAERDALAAQVETLKENAERYQWIRDGYGLVEWKSLTGSANYFLPSGHALDIAIDAAREQKQ